MRRSHLLKSPCSIMLHLMQLFYRINTAKQYELWPFMHRNPQQQALSMVQRQYGSISDPIDVDDDSQRSLLRTQGHATASHTHEEHQTHGHSGVKMESQPELQQQVTEEPRSASTASDAFTFPATPWPELTQVRAIVNGTC